MNFVFYDIRATGEQSHFDQILEIAAIQTDANFNGLARIQAACRLMPHIAPSPIALLASGAKASKPFDNELPSFLDFVGQIEATFRKWSPATFFQYNAKASGEPMLRHALFQTLRDPELLRSNGNRSLDAIDLAQAASCFAPGVLEVSPDGGGSPSFAFPDLAAANGVAFTRNHNVLARVLATIHLARRIAERAPELWAIALAHADNASLAAFIESVPAFRWTRLCDGRSVSDIVAALGPNPEARDEILVLDLANDEPPMFLTDTAVVSCLTTDKTLVQPLRIGGAGFVSPFDLTPMSGNVEAVPAGALAWAHDLRTPAFASFRRQLLRAYLRTLRPNPSEPSPYVESQLDDAVISRRARELCAAFHAAPWEQRPAIVRKMNDPRLREFGRRILAFERRNLLNHNERSSHLTWLKQRLKGDVRVPWRTLPDAIAEITAARASDRLDSETITGLEDHLAVCQSRLRWRQWP